ncbi:hypothetical protein V8G57_21645 [Collimonas sp. H4R21]|uniref:Uncharacterized protein n=1 Tax=Collimonas rhizosphaerae TaxID=3126357 RepID=A0ABU9Q1E5_9BURK
MKKSLNIGLPIGVAICTPPIIAVGYTFFSLLLTAGRNESVGSIISLVFIGSFLVSAGHIFLFGLPGVWLLRTLKIFRSWTVILLGLFLGSIPAGIFLMPRYTMNAGYISNGIVMIKDGVPTQAWWNSYFQNVAIVGGLGALTGFVFWLVWKRCNPTD